ncbi:hypothetical protein Fot_27028 [Forsythia ovata]|uniref:Uncharacterized protein n=1 Tax=Forsythia ovata TaxID=205694 RepID=A0ABD1UDP0_9LAMI
MDRCIERICCEEHEARQVVEGKRTLDLEPNKIKASPNSNSNSRLAISGLNLLPPVSIVIMPTETSVMQSLHDIKGPPLMSCNNFMTLVPVGIITMSIGTNRSSS